MENRQQQILSEIKEMMTSIRAQLEHLDAKMAELQYEVDPQSFTTEPIDLELDDFQFVPASEGPAAEMLADTLDEPVDVILEEPVAEELEEPVIEVVEVVEVIEEADDDLPFFDEPEEEKAAAPVIVNDAVQASIQRPVVLDAMAAKQAWRTDMPGAPVRDIRSAISLNDRVLFINRLFDEDPVNFQDTLNALNQMGSLDEAVAYLTQSHPSWNLESELIYRFMMALRRKLN